jgi:hypothetical protein
VKPETTRPSLRSGFTAYSVLSLVTGFLATIAGMMPSIIADLTPASGRQDHTALPYAKCAVRLAAPPRPPHPGPTFRDDA